MQIRRYDSFGGQEAQQCSDCPLCCGPAKVFWIADNGAGVSTLYRPDGSPVLLPSRRIRSSGSVSAPRPPRALDQQPALGVWINRLAATSVPPVITMVFIVRRIGLRATGFPARKERLGDWIWAAFTLGFRIKNLGIDKLNFRPRPSH